MLRFALALGLLAGCASPPALVDGAPASPEALGPVSPEAAPSPEARLVSLAPLAPVAAPTLPAALRPAGGATVPLAAAPDHGAHGAMAAHGTMGHVGPDHPAAEAATPLATALGAYVAIGDALAADDASGAPALARVFALNWTEATDIAPEADPHFWHMRGADVQAVTDAVRALEGASDLDAAREAYGALSAPLASLVEAHGAPVPLRRFTCGMRTDLPEDGVWLQPPGAPRNPYFGSRMLACATPGPRLPALTGDIAPEASGGTDPAMDHEHGDHE